MSREELNLPPLPTTTQQPPPNFNFVECPKYVINIRPPLIKKPITDISKFQFFFNCDDDDGNPVKTVLTNMVVRQLFRYPFHQWEEELEGLLMEDADGVVCPAHIPSVEDVLRLSGPARVMFNHLMDKLDANPNSPIFPPGWEEFIDPPAQLRDYGRIFLLRLKRCVIANANNSDGLDIFHVLDHITHIDVAMWHRRDAMLHVRRRHYHVCRITCGICDVRPPILLHTAIVVWNVRGVNRLDFPNRFRQVIEIHQPSAIFLMETRSSDIQFEYVFSKLGCNMRWISSEGSGLDGGYIVMWDVNLLEASFKKIFVGYKPVLATLLKMKI